MKYLVVRHDQSMDSEFRGFVRIVEGAGWVTAEPKHSDVAVCFGRPTQMDWTRLLESIHPRCRLLVVEPEDDAAAAGALHPYATGALGADRVQVVKYRRKAEFSQRLTQTLREMMATASKAPAPEPFDWPAPLGMNPTGSPASSPADGDAQPDGPAVHGREWLKRDLTDWADGADDRPLLLLGSAGNGKTTMLEWFRAHSADEGKLVISHFCSHERDQTLRPGQIIQSLALQMAQTVRGYRKAIEDSPEARRALLEAESDPVEAWVHCVQEPFTQLPFAGGLLILDALDESRELSRGPGKKDVRTLLELLAARSFTPPKGLRVLISSRPIDDISRLQGDFARIELDSEANRQDIGSYVELRVSESLALQGYLQASHRTAREFSAKLAAQGNFLLAKNLLDALSSSPEFRGIAYDGLPLAHDGYYYSCFSRRIDRQLDELQRKRLPDFLGSVAAVREPLSAQVHARILDMPFADVQAMYDAMSGLLVRAGLASPGIKFYHPTLEEWLRGDEKSNPGPYRIDGRAAEQRLLDWCGRLAADNWIEAPHNRGTETARYLQQFGVDLLASREHFGPAFQLLAALRRLPEILPQWELQCDRLMRRLEQRWVDFDARPDRSQQLKDEWFGKQINLADVVSLLSGMDYETGKYVPLCRTAVELHPDWGTLLQSLLKPSDEDGENDIVFRNDVGVAYAQAWLSAHKAVAMTEQAAAFWRVIEQMAQSPADDAREIAAYCFKHLCQRAKAWSDKEPQLRLLWARYAASEHPTDRMVAGEMAVALAAHGKDVRDWRGETGLAQQFWQPVWPNHRADLYSWTLLLETRGNRATDPWSCAALDARASSDFEWRSAKEQSQVAAQLRRELEGGKLVRSPVGKLLKLPLTPAAQQNAGPRLRLDESLDAFRAAWLDETLRPELLAFFKLLMLHPLWNITELGASLLSDLWKRASKTQGEDMLDALQAVAGQSPLLWRLRYGLIDAAYNAGAMHGYDRFLRLVLAWGGKQPDEAASCRVQGICADDLIGWMSEAAVQEVRDWLDQPAAKALLADWLEHAEDIWLLEYLHALFNELRRTRKDDDCVVDFRSIFEVVRPATLSRFLRGGHFGHSEDGFFPDVPASEFLLKVDALRREEARLGMAP